MVEYYYIGYGILLNSIDNSNINLSNINPFRYRGYYLNARFYDIDSGRFITMDDISYLVVSNTVHSYNLFTYCENNPIMYVDESGHAMIDCFYDLMYILNGGRVSNDYASIGSTHLSTQEFDILSINTSYGKHD